MIDGLFDLCFRLEINKARDPLIRLNEAIGWEMFRPDFELIRQKKRKSNAGAKGYDLVLMFIILVLQSLYNLSDDQAEF